MTSVDKDIRCRISGIEHECKLKLLGIVSSDLSPISHMVIPYIIFFVEDDLAGANQPIHWFLGGKG